VIGCPLLIGALCKLQLEHGFFSFCLQLSEGRALYNLGNVYHAKGKHIGRVGQQDPGEFPEDVRSCLQQAVKYYE